MAVRKYPLLLFSVIWVFAGTGCVPRITPTVQQEPSATVFIGIPEISNPLIQAENESMEEFVVRIAARRIINKRPFLIAFSQIGKENLWFGVSRDIKDMEKCWIYETDSIRQCTDEDIRNNFGNQEFPIIFFAFAYSNTAQKLFVLDYYHPWVEQDSIDGYRLVIEFQDGKWIEKSMTPVY